MTFVEVGIGGGLSDNDTAPHCVDPTPHGREPRLRSVGHDRLVRVVSGHHTPREQPHTARVLTMCISPEIASALKALAQVVSSQGSEPSQDGDRPMPDVYHTDREHRARRAHLRHFALGPTPEIPPAGQYGVPEVSR